MRKLVWRWMEDGDTEAVKALHAQMEIKVGSKLDLPDLMSEPVIGCVVGEVDGVITHCVFAEAEVEMCAASPNVLTAKETQGAVDLLLPVLLGYKIRIARAFVPSVMLDAKSKRGSPLARTMKKLNFTKENSSVSTFFRWLVPKDREKK